MNWTLKITILYCSWLLWIQPNIQAGQLSTRLLKRTQGWFWRILVIEGGCKKLDSSEEGQTERRTTTKIPEKIMKEKKVGKHRISGEKKKKGIVCLYVRLGVGNQLRFSLFMASRKIQMYFFPKYFFFLFIYIFTLSQWKSIFRDISRNIARKKWYYAVNFMKYHVFHYIACYRYIAEIWILFAFSDKVVKVR